MKFVPELEAEDQQQLQHLLKTSANHRVRQRAHAILLSARGYSIDALADIFAMHRNTISEWLDLWINERSTCLETALEDAPRSGRPLSITDEQQKMLLSEIQADPRSITKALRSIKKK